ncbi:MAG: hypothetical protein ACE5F1_06190 [Planctomycetota bacterium]
MRIKTLSSLLLSLAVLCMAGRAPAQDAFKSALPKDTLLYLAAPDLPAAVEGFKQSAVYKIWREDEVQEFLEDLLAEGQKRFREGLDQAKQMYEGGLFPVSPEEILKIRVRALNFALTDLSAPGPNDPMPRVSVVLSIDFGESGKIVQPLLDTLLMMGMQQPDAPELSKKAVGENQLQTLRAPDMPPFLSINFGFVGGRLLIGTDTERLESIMKSLGGGESEGGLAGDPAYSKVAKRVGDLDTAVEVFIRPAAMIDVALELVDFVAQMQPVFPVNPEGIKRAADALGLRSVKAIGCVSGYSEGKGASRSFVLCPENERRGLTACSSGKAIDLEHLAYIPKEVDSFSIGNLDLKPVYSSLVTALQAYDSDKAAFILSRVSEVEKQIGLSVENDVFGVFGPELIFYSMPVSGLMGTPEMGLMVQCKEPARAVRVLKTLTSMSEGVVELAEDKADDGTTFYALDIDFGDMIPGFDMSMLGGEPTFTFKQGFMVCSMSRADCRNALKRIDGQGGEDVRANKAFNSYFLPEKVAALSFQDMAASIDALYRVLSGVIGMFPLPPEVPIDLGLLPSTETITKHLFGSISYQETDSEGFLTKSMSPFGPEAGIALMGAVAGGAAVFLGERRGAIRRVRRK